MDFAINFTAKSFGGKKFCRENLDKTEKEIFSFRIFAHGSFRFVAANFPCVAHLGYTQ